MRMDLTRPCANCPFRKDIPAYLTKGRAKEIADGLLRDQTFSCHKTVDYKKLEEEDPDYENAENYIPGPKDQHCAGALILLERMNRPSQLMRIFERTGGYDHTKLDMKAPVYPSLLSWINAQEDDRAVRHRRQTGRSHRGKHQRHRNQEARTDRSPRATDHGHQKRGESGGRSRPAGKGSRRSRHHASRGKPK